MGTRGGCGELAAQQKMRERPAAGESHPLLYLPVSEAPVFPSHTPCLLFNQRRECMHEPCSHHQGYSLLFFLLFEKIIPLSEEGDTLLFNHSLICSFNTIAIYWVPLGSVLGIQTQKGCSAHLSGTSLVQLTCRSTVIMVSSERCREGTFRVPWEPLDLLCGMREAFPVEEALSQGVRDDSVRLKNVLVCRGAFQMDEIAQRYQSACSCDRNTMQTNSG